MIRSPVQFRPLAPLVGSSLCCDPGKRRYGATRELITDWLRFPFTSKRLTM